MKTRIIAKNATLVGFDAADGISLAGMLVEPRKPKAAAIHVHGLGGSFYNSNSIPEIAGACSGIGILFLSILNRGSYVIEEFSSAGKHSGILAGSALERFEDCIYDIAGAIAMLKRMGYRRFFLEGHSTGCQKVLYFMNSKRFQAYRKGVAGIALLAPVDDYNYDRLAYGKRQASLVDHALKLKKKKELLMPKSLVGSNSIIGVERFLSTAMPERPEARILNYRLKNMSYIQGLNVPMLVVFGSKDEYMTDTSVNAAVGKLKHQYSGPSIECAVISGTGHTFHGKRLRVAETIASFYSRLL